MSVFDTIAFDDLIRYALALVVIAAALAAILYTIWGGFLMILSGGQEEKVKKAVNHIRHAGIGIIFLLLVLFILPLVARFMGLAYGEYARPNAIFETITEISGRVFGVDSQSESVVPGSSSPLPADFSDL